MVKHMRHGHDNMHHAESRFSRFANTVLANARVPVAADFTIELMQVELLKAKATSVWIHSDISALEVWVCCLHLDLLVMCDNPKPYPRIPILSPFTFAGEV